MASLAPDHCVKDRMRPLTTRLLALTLATAGAGLLTPPPPALAAPQAVDPPPRGTRQLQKSRVFLATGLFGLGTGALAWAVGKKQCETSICEGPNPYRLLGAGMIGYGLVASVVAAAQYQRGRELEEEYRAWRDGEESASALLPTPTVVAGCGGVGLVWTWPAPHP
jgi:hypothetical protein